MVCFYHLYLLTDANSNCRNVESDSERIVRPTFGKVRAKNKVAQLFSGHGVELHCLCEMLCRD